MADRLSPIDIPSQAETKPKIETEDNRTVELITVVASEDHSYSTTRPIVGNAYKLDTFYYSLGSWVPHIVFCGTTFLTITISTMSKNSGQEGENKMMCSNLYKAEPALSTW